MPERNPYLLLGVDYGCPPDLARRSFARAARRVRRAATDAITVEDLNWALHEIQNNDQEPADSVETFRVPADPDVFTPRGDGLFAPGAVRLPRRTEPTESDVDQLVGGLADEALTLVGRLAPRLVQLDYGYLTPGGSEV